MILTPRQEKFVSRSLDALYKNGNTLGVAPTGSGKTIMLSAVIGAAMKKGCRRALIMAHRDEITDQNSKKFVLVNPGLRYSIVDASEKSWNESITFAMVQTLSRKNNLEQMPTIDLLAIDETHHAIADSYRRVIDRVKGLNPNVLIYGVTATPSRGDRKNIGEIFNNCADQITLSEMIAAGRLVKPKTFVIDVGVRDQLYKVRKLASDFDMAEVASIMDKEVVTDEILKHWTEKARDRQTVVFCSTVEHAIHVCKKFNDNGYLAEFVTGDTPDEERAGIFRRLESGQTQILVNVAVATEGWDCPPISCVVLLRPCSYKCTMIQMIGRGLRRVDPEIHPNVFKSDCIVLDFGTSVLLHGSLEQEVDLETKSRKAAKESGVGEGVGKTCPGCGNRIPANTRFCPFCEEEFEFFKSPLTNFSMTEIDCFEKSSFQWAKIGPEVIITGGFDNIASVVFFGDRWFSVCLGKESQTAKVLAIGDRDVCISAADDWISEKETRESAFKFASWLKLPPTDKQREWLPRQYQGPDVDRYMAAKVLDFLFKKDKIQKAVENAKPKAMVGTWGPQWALRPYRQSFPKPEPFRRTTPAPMRQSPFRGF